MYREPTVKGRKLGLKLRIWTRRKKINTQMEQNEETGIQKNEERLRHLWDNFKHSNIRIIGVPEGEEEEQEIENLFENIMKDNFPYLAKEIDVQEAQRVPKKLDLKRHTPRHIVITLPKIKDKERILKFSSKRKEGSYLQRSSHNTIS